MSDTYAPPGSQVKARAQEIWLQLGRPVGLDSRIWQLAESELTCERVVASEQTDRVFIGHGRSPIWKDLRDYLQETLGLPYDEFNRESVAGQLVLQRLEEMSRCACFAFLVLTPEDIHTDGSQHARENVIHELGFFQGRLGVKKAIAIVEESCREFTNILGLNQIRFRQRDLASAFEDVLNVLKREGVISVAVNAALRSKPR